jgi:hypothetical protein
MVGLRGASVARASLAQPPRRSASGGATETPKYGALAGRSVGGPLTPCFRAALLLFVQSESAADVVVRYRFCCSYVKKDLL